MTPSNLSIVEFSNICFDLHGLRAAERDLLSGDLPLAHVFVETRKYVSQIVSAIARMFPVRQVANRRPQRWPVAHNAFAQRFWPTEERVTDVLITSGFICPVVVIAVNEERNVMLVFRIVFGRFKIRKSIGRGYEALLKMIAGNVCPGGAKARIQVVTVTSASRLAPGSNVRPKIDLSWSCQLIR